MTAIMPMAECHIDAIAALEKLCFSDPWSRNSIVSELNNEWSFWLVAVDGDTVAGYIGSQLVPPEADVMNLAVAPAYRRQGVGQSLLNALTFELKQRQISSLSLEVRLSNTPARTLYEKKRILSCRLPQKILCQPRRGCADHEKGAVTC